jgi:hypothetical protein
MNNDTNSKKRCPTGSHRNKHTRRCESTTNSTGIAATNKRCAKGTRRDKQTQLCKKNDGKKHTFPTHINTAKPDNMASKLNKAKANKAVSAPAKSETERRAIVLAWMSTYTSSDSLHKTCSACGELKELYQDDCYLCVACENVFYAIKKEEPLPPAELLRTEIQPQQLHVYISFECKALLCKIHHKRLDHKVKVKVTDDLREEINRELKTQRTRFIPGVVGIIDDAAAATTFKNEKYGIVHIDKEKYNFNGTTLKAEYELSLTVPSDTATNQLAIKDIEELIYDACNLTYGLDGTVFIREIGNSDVYFEIIEVPEQIKYNVI